MSRAERPVHITEPVSAQSDASDRRRRSTMRSTDAVTSSGIRVSETPSSLHTSICGNFRCMHGMVTVAADFADCVNPVVVSHGLSGSVWRGSQGTPAEAMCLRISHLQLHNVARSWALAILQLVLPDLNRRGHHFGLLRRVHQAWRFTSV